MITAEQSLQLKDYFPAQAHEFLQGNTYQSEEAITNRLDDVDPSWEFHRLGDFAYRDNSIIATFRLTVSGVSRDGIGMWDLTIKKKDGTTMSAVDPEKSVSTDALKRAARLFGIGRYILEMKGVNDYRSLENWLAQRRGVNRSTGEIKLVQNGTQAHQEGATGDLQQSTDDLARLAQKTPSERLGTPQGQTVAPRIAGTGFPMGDFKTRCLKEIYANNAIHMNKSLAKLVDAGVLNYDTMTLQQAFEVVQTRKENVPA
jgi:hypothetical protein